MKRVLSVAMALFFGVAVLWGSAPADEKAADEAVNAAKQDKAIEAASAELGNTMFALGVEVAFESLASCTGAADLLACADGVLVKKMHARAGELRAELMDERGALYDLFAAIARHCEGR